METERLEAGVFDLAITGGGTINGVDFSSSGAGRGDTRDGRLKFGVSFSALAEGMDPLANVFSSLILPTGLFGQEVDGALSLLSLAQGEFAFRQVLGGDGIAARSFGTLSRSASRGFTWASRAEGLVDLRSVSEIHPVWVVMIPSGPGRLTETIEWSVVDADKTKRFHAVRDFTFSPSAELPALQLRDVTLTADKGERNVSVSIVSRIVPFPTPD